MDSQFVNQARALPLEQRIELIDALWESLADDGYEPPLTPAELDHRLAAHRNNPDDVHSWESIRDELFRKYR